MASLKMETLPTVSRQNLLAEFSGLKQACPEGVFVSLTPGDPTLWSGVLFVRKGPYSPAVLRFQMSFPDRFPDLPPLVTFSTDIFHPLITPLTTYMYSTDVAVNGTVSASDEERLPPGGFSLRHGFPDWFGRSSRSASVASRRTSHASAPQTPPRRTGVASITATPESGCSKGGSVRTATPSALGTGTPGFMQTRGKWRDAIPAYDVLHYIRSAFDSEKVLDLIPLEAAGNPGAWHAWRTHRIQEGKLFPGMSGGPGGGAGGGGGIGVGAHVQELDPTPSETTTPTATPTMAVPSATTLTATAAATPPSDPDGQETAPTLAPVPIAAKAGNAGAAARRPGEWNWEGVWEQRVKKGIESSTSEAVLFGNASVADELINFLKMDENEADTIKDNLSRTLGNSVQ